VSRGQSSGNPSARAVRGPVPTSSRWFTGVKLPAISPSTVQEWPYEVIGPTGQGHRTTDGPLGRTMKGCQGFGQPGFQFPFWGNQEPQGRVHWVLPRGPFTENHRGIGTAGGAHSQGGPHENGLRQGPPPRGKNKPRRESTTRQEY